MCFSAESSFAASGLLLLSGAYCIRATARPRPAFLPLAAVPILFGAQQFAEGLVWVGLAREDPVLAQRASLTFLFFAICFWPFWAPLSAACLAGRPGVRAALLGVAGFGLAFGLLLWAPMAWGGGRYLEVGVQYHSIQYRVHDLPAFAYAPRGWWQAAYLAIIFCPFAVTPDRRFTLFCALLAVSAVVSHVVFWYAFISVFCFFAALLSLHLCYVLTHLGEAKDASSPATAPEPPTTGG